MDNIILIRPIIEYGEQILDFKNEVLQADGTGSFDGCGDLLRCSTAEEWIEILNNRLCDETCPRGSVPSDTYLAVRVADNRLVGIIDLRHHINHPILSVWGGHIGYTVRPSERRKGYVKEMLRQDIRKCKQRGINNVLITCSSHNVASEKTILANGGIFENEVTVDGEKIKRFWINL